MGDIDGAKEQNTVKISKANISVSKIAENVNALAGWSFVVDTEEMEDAPAEIISKDLRRQPHPSMPPLHFIVQSPRQRLILTPYLQPRWKTSRPG
jgi:hypothetical protein